MSLFLINQRWRKYVILFSFGSLALIIRAQELGKWCFTVDEYYYYNSVIYILEKGLPQFPSGGYYIRGPLLQYLIALTSLVFPEPEFAARFVPLLFGVLSVPLFFLVCSQFLPTYPAILCTSILLLSSWHIEFSRFARMYAPFQFSFFSFIYYFYSGYFLNNRTHKIVSWVIAFLSILIFEGSIFFPFILLLPILLDESPLNRRNLKYILSVIILIGANYVVYGVNYRQLNVIYPYPKEYQLENQFDLKFEKRRSMSIEKLTFNLPVLPPKYDPSQKEYRSGKPLDSSLENRRDLKIEKLGFNLPLFLPKSDLLKTVLKSIHLSFGYILCVIGGIYVFINNIKNRNNFWEQITVVLATLLPLIYQYGLLFYLLILLFISHESVSHVFFEKRRYWIPYFVLTILYWISVGISMRILLFPGESQYNRISKMLIFLFDYPLVYEAIYIPFSKILPKLGIIVFLMLLVSTFLQLIGKGGYPKKFLILVSYLCILMVSAITTQYTEARYSFFYFPLLFILIFIETVFLKNLAVEYFEKYKMKKYCNIILFIPVILFISTEDFHFNHILNVSTKEFNFRIGKYNKYSSLWYPRSDLKTPSEFVNKAYKNGDIVVVGAVGSAFYLDKPFINYIDHRNVRFLIMSRKEGKEEIWTGRPLVHNLEDFFHFVPNSPDQSLWLIAGLKDCMPDTFDHSASLMDISKKRNVVAILKYEGIDGRVGVWKLNRLTRSEPIELKEPPKNF
jgi:hypothetical protein